MAQDLTGTIASPADPVAELIFDPAVRANPYPAYERMRAIDPVLMSSIGFWFVTSYKECARLMKDPRLVRRYEDSWEVRAQLNDSVGRTWMEHQSRWMLWLDPPDHGRIRGLVTKAFTPRYVEKLRDRVQKLVDGLIDHILEAGECDLIAQLAFPLPITVISDMLGVPGDDRKEFRGLTVDMAQTLEPLPPKDVQDRADEAALKLESYFLELIAERRKNPGDDLLSALIEAEEKGERLDEKEVVATAALLLGAGFETTTNLIGNGSLALLRYPEQWDALKNDPALARPAVEELLRYDSPVQLATPRVASAPVELGGHTLEPGETVISVVGGANRDPSRFEQPENLDLLRKDPAPLSFGGGAHFCLGASLARMEGAIVFESMARRLEKMSLVEEPAWRRGLNLRGLEALRMSV